MDKPSRKRKADMFSPEAVRARMSSKAKFMSEFNSHVDFFRGIDLSTIHDFKEEEALLIVSSKLTFQGMFLLKCAMNHVPCSFSMSCREFDGLPLRSVLIHDIVQACSTTSSLASIADVHFYVSFLERFCPQFVSTSTFLPQDQLWKLCKNGKYRFTKFLSPPLQSCMNCGEGITMHNPPSNAKVFTLQGPMPASKITLECRACEMSYGIGRYRDTKGYHYYPKTYQADVIEVTNNVYIAEDLYRWLPSLSNHSWVSFSGFSEAYNEVYLKEIDIFCNMLNADSEETDDDENDAENDDANNSATVGLISGELSAKLAAKSYWRRELEEELDDLGIREKWSFTKTSSSDLPYSGSEEEAMEFAERKRSEQLYAHTCSKRCKDKGCGSLFVADGNWKLRYAHCMWKVPVTVPGFGNANYPSICPLSPQRGHAFCEKHCKVAQAAGYPSELRLFLKRCGVPDVDKFTEIEETALLEVPDSETPGSNACDSSVDAIIEANLIACAETSSPDDQNASSFQGTGEFLQSHPEFIDSVEQEVQVNCNKDTGGRKTLHCWSRGIFFIVSAGGHIDYWQPLYRSESPTQAYLVLVVWLYRKHKALQDAGKSSAEIKSAMESTILAYDNMCHVDSLKISKKDLPFPEPFNKAWSSVTKVIDRLHLRNHKDPRCKRLYDADGKIPSEFNTMSCEQTFVWASRMKKIVCAMTRLHQFFFVHRSVKRRNKYTEMCHVRNKTPVLPKLPQVNKKLS